MRKRVGRIYGLKYSWQGHKERNRHKHGIKRSGRARLVYVKAQPQHLLHPMAVWRWNWKREAIKAVLYCVEYDTQMSYSSFCLKLKFKKGGKPLLYYVEYHSEKQTLPSCMVFGMTERGKHYHLVWCSAWLKEANTTILYGVRHDWKRQTLPSCIVFSMT